MKILEPFPSTQTNEPQIPNTELKTEDSSANQSLSIQRFDRKPDPEDRHRPAIVRKTIAYRMFWLIAFIVVALLAAFFYDIITLEEAKEIATLLLTPIISIYGMVVGFFFGASAD